MFNNIRGLITFEAIAAEPEMFVNCLMESDISVSELHCKNGKIYGNVYMADFKEVEKIAVQCNAQICIYRKRGSIFIVQKYRKRAGLAAGFLLAFMMLVYLSNTVMVIEIYGNENVTDNQVISLLNDSGIHIGTFVPNVDLREAERKIVSSSDEIAWIGIRSSGSRIQAEIREMDVPPDMVSASVPCNVISSKDAQIVEIRNVNMGMLVPMLYDGVKKGELLISGTVEDGKGGVYYAHAMGEIIGRYNEKVTFVQAYTDEHFDYDGRITKKTFSFFGLKLPLYMERNDFEQYEYDETTTYLKLFNMQLPIGIIYSEYIPYRINTVEYTSEQAKAILEDKIKLYEYNFFDKEDVAIVDREVLFSEENDKMTAVIKYTLEGNIGITQEIMAK